MRIFHVTDADLEGFWNAEPEVVKQVVRHLLSGCETCSEKVGVAIGGSTEGLSLSFEGLLSPRQPGNRTPIDLDL
jgi:hypothetical protein